MADSFQLTYRYRLYPTKAQVSVLERTLGVCRDVYNSLVHERTVLYETQGKSPSRVDQCREITTWKAEHPELHDVYSQVLQNITRRVDLAFQAFFRRVRNGEEPGHPRRKGKGQYDSITYPQSGFGFYQGKLRLSKISNPKISDVAIHLHRPIGGNIKTCTICRTATGKWFVCFSCEVEPEPLEPSAEDEKTYDEKTYIGIDVGLKVFAALSNGEFIENPRFFRRDEKALAKAQRKFDRVKHKHRTNSEAGCRKSQARRKAKKVVSRIHERIACRRHDFVHQTARRLVNRFGVIGVESLSVENMMASPKAKPDPEHPGQFLPNGASAKAGLNKSIADASWSMFRNVLTMKAERAFRLVVAVPPHYTSAMCSGCGNIAKKTLSVRTHRCLVCGLCLDRDTNAAVNIQAAVGQHSLAALAA